MRFAIAAVDRYLGVFESFTRAGWQPVKLFTVPVRSMMGNQQMVIAYAEQNNAAIQLSRMTEGDLQELRKRGCEALIVASYDWKVPDWTPFLKYGVNFHSSPLPEGRGSYPVVRAILEKRSHWAVTCHRLTPEIDSGEILATEKFPLQPDECHESLDLKVQMAAKKLAARMAGSFTTLWDQAQPQTGGSYWPKHTLPERVLDFCKPVAEIMHYIRAFGNTECLTHINNTWLVVRRGVGWTEAHDHIPGSVVHVFNHLIVVAAADGYIGILDSNLAPPHVAAEMQAASTHPSQTARAG